MMKAILIAAATILQAYLLGSVDTGILVSKFVYHDDVRNHGSGAAGMTNMLRTFGKKAAAMTATGDVLKGVLAVCVGRWLFHMLPADAGVSPYLGVYLAAIFAVLGHLYPLYFGFKGGKGIAASSGVIVALGYWPLILLGFCTFMIVTIISRYVSLGSLVMMTGFLVEFIIFAVNGMIPGLYPAELVEAVVIVAILTVLAFWRHRANIVRLVHGNERRLWGGNKEKNSN